VNGAYLLLLVAVPLAAAATAALVRAPAVQRGLALAVPAAGTVAGVLLVLHHRSEPVVAHQTGGFIPGVAIPFVSDTLSAVLITVTSFTSLVCVAFLAGTGEDRYRLVPALVLMLLGGVNGALLTGDLFNLFVFIEVMLLPSYALIAVTGTWRRLGIGRYFVVVNLLTSTILLIGVGLVYATAGTVNLAQLAGRAAEEPMVGLAVAVVLLALGIKAGVVPAHGWLPRSYPATSAGMMALFSALHTKVALYAIFRVYAVTYEGEAPWLAVLAVVVGLTVVVGAVSTFAETVVRRALAFQMVTGVGHILIGLVLFTPLALAAGLFYLVHHIVTMASLVLTAGAIEQTYGSGRFDRLSGLARRDRWVATVAALGLFSLVGLPPSSGFFAKVGLVQAAAERGGWQQWTFVTLIIVAALATLVAMQRLWAKVFWGPDLDRYRPDSPETGRAPMTSLPPEVRVSAVHAAPGAVLLGAALALFLAAGAVLPVLLRAAGGLLDTVPYIEAVLP